MVNFDIGDCTHPQRGELSARVSVEPVCIGYVPRRHQDASLPACCGLCRHFATRPVTKEEPKR